MSEDHAIYFASAEPGLESAFTTRPDGEQSGGEQPSQEPGDSDITQQTPDEQATSFAIGTHENGKRQPTPGDNSPSGGDQLDDDSALEQGSINLMDDVVNSFRRKEITKFKALSNILAVLDSNTTKPEKTKDAPVKYYSRTLNEIEALAASAIRRGLRTQRGLQPSMRPSPEPIHAERQ